MNRWSTATHSPLPNLDPMLAGAAFAAGFAAAAGINGIVLGLALAVLALCSLTDLRTMRVPNVLTYSGTILVLLAAVLLPGADVLDAFTGWLAAGVAFLSLNVLSRGAVGLGDTKLAAFGGGLLGLTRVFPALLLGTVAAGVFGVLAIVLGRLSRKDPFPFAPFLSVGFAAVALLSGTSFTS